MTAGDATPKFKVTMRTGIPDFSTDGFSVIVNSKVLGVGEGECRGMHLEFSLDDGNLLLVDIEPVDPFPVLAWQDADVVPGVPA